MNDVTKAYFAGLFDGEGCVLIQKNGIASYGIQVRIEMIDIEPLIVMHNEWGGSLHIIDHKKENWRLTQRIVLSSKDGKKFMEDILPYTMIKTRQIKLALRFLRECKGKLGQKPSDELVGRRMFYKNKLSHLKAVS